MSTVLTQIKHDKNESFLADNDETIAQETSISPESQSQPSQRTAESSPNSEVAVLMEDPKSTTELRQATIPAKQPSSSFSANGSIALHDDLNIDLNFINSSIANIDVYLANHPQKGDDSLIESIRDTLIRSRSLFDQVNLKNNLYKISVHNQIERSEIETNLLKDQINALNKFNFLNSLSDKQKVEKLFNTLQEKNNSINRNLQKLLVKNKSLKIKLIEKENELINLRNRMGESDSAAIAEAAQEPKKRKMSSSNNMLDTLGLLATRFLSEDANSSAKKNVSFKDLDKTIEMPQSDLDETIDAAS